MKKWMLIVFLLLVLQGCGLFSREETLDAPSQLRKVQETIVWDAVEGAQAYQILRDGLTFQVVNPEYSIFDLPNGSYTIEVRASKGEKRSEWTSFSFTIERTLDHPTNVRIVDQELLWDAPAVYSQFRVTVNETVFHVDEAVFNLVDLDDQALYEITVTTEHLNQLSQPSRTVYFHTYRDVLSTTELTYNQAMLRNVTVELSDVIEIETVLLHHQRLEFSFFNDVLSLAYSDLLNLNPELTYTLDVITPEGRIEIIMDIEYVERPYLMSSRTTQYQTNQNIVYQFELFSGTFNGLSGQDITEADYTFSDGTLTINASFIESLLTANPERTRVIFSYVLETEDGDIFIGYLFIDIP